MTAFYNKDLAEVELLAIVMATPIQRTFMERRELPLALAKEMDRCLPGAHRVRLMILNRLFYGMNSRDRIKVRVELRALSLVRSGQLDAAAALRGRLP